MHLVVSVLVTFLLTYRKIVRNRTKPYLEEFVLDAMCGAVSHRGTDFASHLLNAALDHARVLQKSTLSFFVDVVVAFGFSSIISPVPVPLTVVPSKVIHLQTCFSISLLPRFSRLSVLH